MNIQHKEIIKLGKHNGFNKFMKRSFDILVSFIGLIITSPIILASVILVRVLYGESGFFTQKRVGKNGKKFRIVKIRTMNSKVKFDTNVTTDKDPRITKLGRVFRKTKIDELPQLFNVLVGDMSFVGPRPDVEETINNIKDENKKNIFLSIRPGITGPASIKYKNEEEILSKVDNSEIYNKEIIFPDKVNLNKEYIENYSFSMDIKYIINTIIG
ncbi:sugar transferase [Clostridium sardiniense]|uniref:Sugar transferase n=1 Tax=Clostridium sardiniense TaxID=29369 RepID=A0ABS7KSZ1_CLOSR|nr:sugar transferase [Clostridium sardiniense]MBY0753930.1 sugar transferase [Clostridium sardiniense]MDQ0459555.1 lipopolysaccharide/colanic/teichoic acid biosynthesis glycosyltransferase [Clostridium sardiniense]